MITMPAPSSLERVATADGLWLHVEHFLPDTPPSGTLVVVHGFSAHLGNYRHVASACARGGLAATLFDCRGHGQSQGRRGHVNRFSDFVADLDLVVARVRTLWPAIPLSLVGHSHGALVSLAYLLEAGTPTGRLTRGRQGLVRTLALVAPFFDLRLKVPAVKRALARPLGRLWPTLAMGNGIKGNEISRTPEVQAGFYTDPLIHHVATPRWFNEVRATQAWARAAAGALETPTLIQMAGDDRLVSNEATLAFAHAAGAIVELKRYDKLFHEMFLEPEREQVIDDLVRWTLEKQRS
ncbi:MAG TPA: alpha/beta hydrolase [Polyangia bacterium]|jgi:alpha-beta hydrolase superfamily lysophospholipase|nr:alpha/beta hydrolase [Polyangia bacterium]